MTRFVELNTASRNLQQRSLHAQAKGNGGIQEPFHCVAHGETVGRSGRDEIFN